MRVLSLIADKNLAGVEDASIGAGHIEQTRGTPVLLHKLNVGVNLGLLSECDFDFIDSEYNLLRFEGFYTIGDGGEGFYERVAIPVQHDIGMYIANDKGVVWKRKYSHFVRPIWFGAKGDGKSDDTQAMLKALSYGSVMLDKAHYVINLLNNVEIKLEKNVDLRGNSSIIEVKSLLDSKLTLTLADDTFSVKFRNIKFITKLSRICYFENTDRCKFDIDFLNTYEPQTCRPDVESVQYVTIADDRVVNFTKFTKPIRSNKIPTDDRHPVIKKSVKPQELPYDAVTLSGDQTILGEKLFTKPIAGVRAKSDTGIVTLDQLNSTLYLKDETKQEIDTWLATQHPVAHTSATATGMTYIQFPDSPNPNELFDGTEWIRITPDDVDVLYKVVTTPSDGSLNGNLPTTHKDLDSSVFIRTKDNTPLGNS